MPALNLNGGVQLMRLSFQVVIMAAITFFASSQVSADQGRVLARCGPSLGQAFYPDDKSPSWASDAISKGGFAFVVDGAGKPDVLTKDIRGDVYDPIKDGAEIRFTFRSPEAFGLLVTYPGYEIVETYSVITAKDGRKVALWTSNRGEGSGQTAKVAAYRSACQ